MIAVKFVEGLVDPEHPQALPVASVLRNVRWGQGVIDQ